MPGLLDLASDQLTAAIDVHRGADVLSLVHRATGVEIMLATPWRERALALRSGSAAPTTYDPVAGPLEQYAGGWIVLCPNTGARQPVTGAPMSFHGEAWLAPWQVVEASTSRAVLETELHFVPLRMTREVIIDEDTLTMIDTLTNLSDVELEIDYCSHPTLSTEFLSGPCTITTGAATFVSPPKDGSSEPHGSPWPSGSGPDGETLDVSVVPEQGPVARCGWLADFDGHWAAVTNPALGLTATVTWDGEHLPYAWLWEELNATAGYPWYRRARVMAIEPSSVGPSQRSVLRVPPSGPAFSGTVRIPVSLTVASARG